MTASELIELLKTMPPDSPILARCANSVIMYPVFGRSDYVHKAPDGFYGKFCAKKNEHRNNIKAVIIE